MSGYTIGLLCYAVIGIVFGLYCWFSAGRPSDDIEDVVILTCLSVGWVAFAIYGIGICILHTMKAINKVLDPIEIRIKLKKWKINSKQA